MYKNFSWSKISIIFQRILSDAGKLIAQPAPRCLSNFDFPLEIPVF